MFILLLRHSMIFLIINLINPKKRYQEFAQLLQCFCLGPVCSNLVHMQNKYDPVVVNHTDHAWLAKENICTTHMFTPHGGAHHHCGREGENVHFTRSPSTWGRDDTTRAIPISCARFLPPTSHELRQNPSSVSLRGFLVRYAPGKFKQKTWTPTGWFLGGKKSISLWVVHVSGFYFARL